MRIILGALIGVLACGCAPHTEQAVRQTERISELAQSSGERFERIGQMSRDAEPDLGEIESEATSGQVEQAEIQQAAAAARRQIVHTQDIRSPWVSVLMLWAAVFLAAFIVIALIYLGIAPVARRVINGHARARQSVEQTSNQEPS